MLYLRIKLAYTLQSETILEQAISNNTKISPSGSLLFWDYVFMCSVVIFGRANGVWEELAEALSSYPFDYVIGVGSAVVDYPGRVDVLVSFHIELMSTWLDRRRAKGFSGIPTLFSSSYKGRTKPARAKEQSGLTVHYVQCAGGSSGLIATKVALNALKATRVVLAGIPMQASSGAYDKDTPWKEAAIHQGPWKRDVNELKDKVRSMSGWTQELLGSPDISWFNGAQYLAA